MKMDHPVTAKRSDFVNHNKTISSCSKQTKKRKWKLVDFAVPYHRIKVKESEKLKKYLDLPRELKTVVKYEYDSDTCPSYSP